MPKKAKKSTSSNQKHHLLPVAILLSAIFAVLLFAYAGFNFSSGKGAILQNQFVQKTTKIEIETKPIDSKHLKACLASKGWLDEVISTHSKTKFSKYCVSFKTVATMKHEPTRTECESYKLNETATISTQEINYDELSAACEIMYPPIPPQPFKVDLVSQKETVNGFTYNHDVAVWRLKAPRNASVQIDDIGIRYSTALGNFDEIDLRGWTLEIDGSRPFRLTDMGPVRVDGTTRINRGRVIEAGKTLEIAAAVVHDTDDFDNGDTYTIELVADMLNPVNTETGEPMELDTNSLVTDPIEVQIDESPSIVEVTAYSPEESEAGTGFTHVYYDHRYCVNYAVTREYLGVFNLSSDTPYDKEITSLRFRIDRDSNIFSSFGVATLRAENGDVIDTGMVEFYDGSDEFTIDLTRNNYFRYNKTFLLYSWGVDTDEASRDEADGDPLSFELIGYTAIDNDRTESEVILEPLPVSLTDLEVVNICSNRN